MTATEHAQAEHPETCCGGVGARTAAETASESARAFGALMRAMGAEGALDARTKELIIFALVVYSRCATCVISHIEKAHKMGISDAELEEASWCAVGMGGAAVRQFYLDTLFEHQRKMAK